MNYNEINSELLDKLSFFLNSNSNYINKAMIDNLEMDEKDSFIILLFTILGYDMENKNDRYIYHSYFHEMIKELNTSVYENNPYYKNISITSIKSNKWKFENKKYEPYELFVYNDLKLLEDGRLIPRLGYFNKEYYYPCVLENNREWMLITPNEIETMKKPIEMSNGNVLTYGLGLGYFAYMVSNKENVKTITIIEKDKDVIDLFNKYILTQFQNKDKIKIIQMDAFEYEKNYKEKYDFVFVDIWHDPSDGIPLYIKFKSLQRKDVLYSYWIEDTMKYYLGK